LVPPDFAIGRSRMQKDVQRRLHKTPHGVCRIETKVLK
jgi:hypothetical protein